MKHIYDGMKNVYKSSGKGVENIDVDNDSHIHNNKDTYILSLEKINIGNNYIEDKGVGIISEILKKFNFKSMKSLVLYKNNIKNIDSITKILQSSKYIYELDISYNNIYKSTSLDIEKFNSVLNTHMSLSKLIIENSFCSSLFKNGIEIKRKSYSFDLSLNFTQITEENQNKKEDQKSNFNYSQCIMDNQSYSCLESCMCLSQNKYEENFISSIFIYKNLSSLSISNIKLSIKGWMVLYSSLKSCGSIEKLNVSHNNHSSNDLFNSLINTLSSLVLLKILNLSNISMDNIKIKKLSMTLLSSQSKLESLDISSNPFNTLEHISIYIGDMENSLKYVNLSNLIIYQKSFMMKRHFELCFGRKKKMKIDIGQFIFDDDALIVFIDLCRRSFHEVYSNIQYIKYLREVCI